MVSCHEVNDLISHKNQAACEVYFSHSGCFLV